MRISPVTPTAPNSVAHRMHPTVGTSAPHRTATAATAWATPVATETLGSSSMSVRERFDTLEQRFIPAKAKGVNAAWQFLLTGKGGGEWFVEIRNGEIKVKKGRGSGADVTIRADADDYLKVANGEISGMRAWLTGIVKFDGDKGLAKSFKEYFREA